jgi:hypothetical protein
LENEPNNYIDSGSDLKVLFVEINGVRVVDSINFLMDSPGEKKPTILIPSIFDRIRL